MKKAIFLIATFFVLSFAQQAFAQNLDSLYSIWQDQSQHDTVRVQAFSSYIKQGFLFSNTDSAFILAEELVVFGQEKKYPKAQSTGYNVQGVSYHLKANYPKALDYYQRSLKISEVEDKSGIASALNNIGLIYNNQSNDPKALDYYQRSLKIYEEIGDKSGIANTLSNIGNIYNAQSNYPKALDYFQRSLKIMEEIGDKSGIASALNNIGLIYNDHGNYHKALDYFQRSLKIYEEIGDKRGIANTLSNIGIIYNTENKHQDAIIQCQKSLEISEDIGAINFQKNACKCLYDAYKAMGKGNEALVYLEKMQVINDSLHAEETGQKLQQMEFAKQMLQDSIAQAETDRLVLEAHQEEMRVEEKTRNIAIGAGGFLLLLAGGFYSRMRYIRKSRATLQVEKDRSENLLLNILPAEIAEELKQNGRAEARDFDLVSILFTDFKGFTEASAKMSAGMLVDEINTCFEAFDAIMEKYNIEKIKTIGDAYMAAGGLPVPTDDSVKNTVLAALEMQAFISTRKASNDADGLPAFEMRVGIHTGPVVAGIVGVKKFQYDIWGDTVNTASRIESNGEAGKVNISQATYELLKDDPDFAFESRGKIEAKGKGEMEMLFVTIK
ncbi:MAG: tetratricopeptide repeat protein [Bacteroidales bacterium]|nr:tetratricopeptide repeat protein [Bacteroidales bacterium]MCF8455294.1 tetratricopeptide repeat protein [Bacteroidales bacterium]